MADDLIPPPSPAGKPDPNAPAHERTPRGPGEPRRPFEDIGAERKAADVAQLEPAAEATPPRPAVPSPHRGRFAMLSGLVLGVGAAIVVVFVLALGRGTGPSDDGWSSWQPSTSKTYDGAAEVASHVGREYRLDNGKQLVEVESGPVKLDDLDLSVVTSDTTKGGDIQEVKGKGVFFVLNGLGARGSISSGKPTETRGALVRREALELSLYAFKYLDGVDHVVTLLPPPPPGTKVTGTNGKKEKSSESNTPILATLYTKHDLEAQLDVPLARTLSGSTPRPATFNLAQATQLADQIAPHVFTASVTQGQTGQGFLLLQR